jgi:hypothetical protein
MRLEPSELGCASAFLKQGPDTSRPLRFTLLASPNLSTCSIAPKD